MATVEKSLTSSELTSLLKEYNTEKFYIEHHLYRSSHAAHTAVALHHLGATSMQANHIMEHYSERLERKGQTEVKVAESGKWAGLPEGDTQARQQAKDDETPKDLLGERRGFYKLLDHYMGLLDDTYKGNLGGFLSGVFPGLCRGVAGAATHGLIQMGYGIDGGDTRVVCEGLAYLHHSHCPLVSSDAIPPLSTLGQGSQDIIEVITKVKADKELFDFMQQESRAEWITSRSSGPFQNRMTALLVKRGDYLIGYTHQIKFPGFDPEAKTPEQLQSLLTWLVHCSIVVYQASVQENNFFLLHGVTSSWALAQLLPLLADWNDVMEAIRVQICVLFAVYVAEAVPALDTERLSKPEVDQITWDDIKQKALSLDVDTDTHVYKVVQVCLDASVHNTDAAADGIYKRAALTAIDCPSTHFMP